MILSLAISPTMNAEAAQARQTRTMMVVEIENRGRVTIQLHTQEAPRTTAHIIALARDGFYDGQSFYRVVREPKPFLIQTGDPGSKTKSAADPSLGTGGSGTRIPYENSGFSNEEGAVGLSTLPGDRDSGDSQFYILLGEAKFLDGSYTVFGRVTEGMDVVRSVQLGDKVTSVTIVVTDAR